LKRIFIAAALCLVSFQSYAESEMTFHQFNDFYYSSLSLNGDDKSQYFLRYANTTVKEGARVGDPINYSAGKYGDANGFRDACLAKCVGEEKCGGVVFHYYKTDKKTPKKCVLKTLEPTTKTNKKKIKDFYRRICYVGGPGGYLNHEVHASNPLFCGALGMIVVEVADGSFIVVGEPPVTEKLQSDLGTPWVPNKMTMNDSPCWCTTGQCLSYPAFEGDGTPSKSWIAGISELTGRNAVEDDGVYGRIRRELSEYWYANNSVLPDLGKVGDQMVFNAVCDVCPRRAWFLYEANCK
jgi:hypothetical protein